MTNQQSHIAWGILGTGTIAHTFATGLAKSRTGSLVAVGSRAQRPADKFAGEFGFAGTPYPEAIKIAADSYKRNA